MWILCIWALSSLFLNAAVAHVDTPRAASTALPGRIFETIVTPVRVGPKGQTYHKLYQFRKRGQDPWLGTVRYRWRAFHRTWIIVLRHQHYRTSTSPQQHRRRHHRQQYWSRLRRIFDAQSPELRDSVLGGCYYTGRVRGDPLSYVGVRICDGMTGDIHSSLGDFVIYPISNRSGKDGSSILHMLSPLLSPDSHRPWRPLAATGIEFCGVQDKNEVESMVKNDVTNVGKPIIRRRRSESKELHLEVMVVADNKMASYHGNNLRHYILTLMSTVALIYKDPSIGNNINIAVVGITTLNKSVDTDVIHTVAPTTLRKFCNWQQQHNNLDDRDPAHYDVAILITREDLCRFPGACDTLGLAQSGMMCDEYSSCAIVEDNGLSAAFTIAHELGHVMSIPHDDDRRCTKYHDKQKLHVMARMLDYNSHPWSWSECSRQYLTSFFDMRHGRCLMDPPGRNLLKQEDEFQRLPGQLYPRDQQCRLVFGEESEICPYMPECKRLWCTMADGTQGGCRTQHMPWADGTMCDTNKSCHQGECVPIAPTQSRPENGQWGNWTATKVCSRTCGGGVTQFVRECNNPKPKNGGKYCIGVRVLYRSCNTQECEDLTDFRGIQCSESGNNKTYSNTAGYGRQSVWSPHYSSVSADRCKLLCEKDGEQGYQILKDKVVDGTTCGPTTFDICVNGVCERAGCDHILDSMKELDQCGVCGGNNESCREIHGYFEKAPRYGYHDVVMIPPGASNIKIKQRSVSNVADQNYIVLKDPQQNYILNGDYMISKFPKTLLYAGTMIDYSGSASVIEYLNTTNPLKQDLYVEVLIVGDLAKPQLNFSYTVSRTDTTSYIWRVSENEFTECSEICNGEKYRKIRCTRKKDDLPVHDGHCEKVPKPKINTKKVLCNQDCILKWKDVSNMSCSVECGRGNHYPVIECVKEDLSTKKWKTVHEESCYHLKSKPKSKEECYGNCLNSTWKFSEWSECSVTCGEGNQNRMAYCINIRNETQPDSHCPSYLKHTTRRCNGICYPEWKADNWRECSVTCGHGIRKRDVYCVGSDGKSTDSQACDHSTRPPHKENCFNPCTNDVSQSEDYYTYQNENPPPFAPDFHPEATKHQVRAQWKISNWGRCSTTCGTGQRRRNVSCEDITDGSRLPGHYCEGLKPNEAEPCEERMCGQWLSGPFSECYCGIGQKRRQVTCNSKDFDCNPVNKPATEEHCTCDVPKWKTGGWTDCSVTCGKGVKRRRVTCVSGQIHVEDTKCLGEQPAAEEQCEVLCQQSTARLLCPKECNSKQNRKPNCKDNKGLCDKRKMSNRQSQKCNSGVKCSNIYRWRKESWLQCSEVCGHGYKLRKVSCVDDRNRVVDDRACSKIPKPRDRRKCFLKNCTFIWMVGHWSECSTSCGNGRLTRSVTCHHVNAYGWINPDPAPESFSSEEWCNRGKRPRNTKSCNYGSCTGEYYWKPEKWQSCTKPCGTQIQKRKVRCTNTNGVKQPHAFCSSKQKPPRKRPCKDLPKCKPQSCLHVQRLQNARTDGNYIIYVKGKGVTVYCHLMNSTQPKDFIAVNRDNYAEVFSSGKQYSISKPCRQRENNLDCDCNRRDKGFTRFSKLALNTTSLEIIIDDFTFSETFSGQSVNYGTAGDCFHNTHCPRGLFHISLLGTGFRVSSETSWVWYDQMQTTIKWSKSGQVIKGSCGGQCGTCYPRNGLLLDIMP